jgi:hypothetical protein
MKINDEQFKNMECYPELIRLAGLIRESLSRPILPASKAPSRPMSVLRPPELIRFVSAKPQ